MKRALALLISGGILATSAVVALPPANASAGGGGGTTVTISGAVVTINVNFDLCCAADASEQTIYGSIIQEEVKQAQDVWNQALASLPAKGCFIIKANFSAHLLNKPNWDPGYHKINIDFTHPGRPISFDYTPGATHQDDTAYVYGHVTDGTFYDAVMSVTVWAHEIGHLMGLGDDYANGPLHSVPLPGRKGTLMADSNHGVIDKALADRLADIATKAGLKLPSCWKGTAVESLVVGPCTSTVNATIGLVVAGDSTVAGTWTGAEVVVGCNSHAPFSLGTVQFSGKLTGGKFVFPVFPGLIDYPGPVSIPLQSPKSASGHFVWSIPLTGPDTSDITLTCTGC